MLHGTGIFTNICLNKITKLWVNIPYMEPMGNGWFLVLPTYYVVFFPMKSGFFCLRLQARRAQKRAFEQQQTRRRVLEKKQFVSAWLFGYSYMFPLHILILPIMYIMIVSQCRYHAWWYEYHDCIYWLYHHWLYYQFCVSWLYHLVNLNVNVEETKQLASAWLLRKVRPETGLCNKRSLTKLKSFALHVKNWHFSMGTGHVASWEIPYTDNYYPYSPCME